MMGSIVKKTYGIADLLEAAAAIVRIHGFVSKKIASIKGDIPTAQRLLDDCTGHISVVKNLEDADAAIVALKKLDELRRRRESGEVLNSFEDNLSKMTTGGIADCEPGYLTEKDFPFLVCVFMNSEKNLPPIPTNLTEQEVANSNWIGDIGKRDEFFVKLYETKRITSHNFTVYRVKDRNGNLGVFFSSDDANAFGLEVDDCFLVKMTPKEHYFSKYHGGKETKFNRIKIIDNVGSVSKPKGSAVPTEAPSEDAGLLEDSPSPQPDATDVWSNEMLKRLDEQILKDHADRIDANKGWVDSDGTRISNDYITNIDRSIVSNYSYKTEDEQKKIIETVHKKLRPNW